MIEIVPATKHHVDAISSKPMGRTCVAYAALEDDVVIGIVGYYTEKGRRVLFSSLTEKMRKYPVLMFKTGLKVMREAAKGPLPLFATADCNIEASARFLERLGFVKVAKEVWQCPKEEA